MKQAPLFVRCFDLYCWLLDRFDDSETGCVQRVLLDRCRRLLESATLGLQGHDPLERAYAAEEAAALARLHLRVAEERKLLTLAQYERSVEALDEIGGHLSAWRRQLERDL